MDKRILYVDLSGYRPLPSGESLHLLSHGATVESVTDEHAAISAVHCANQLSIIACNAPSLALFEAARRVHPKAQTVLVTESPMKVYSQALDDRETQLLDHVIANRSPDAWTIHALRVTVQKILTNDIFGIAKYLSPGTRIHDLMIRGTADRGPHNKAVMDFASECKLGQHAAKTAYGISEELMMNVIYDAPVAAGLSHYADVPRLSNLALKPEEYGRLSFGCDGRLLVISASDPFGALTKEKLMSYLRKVLRRDDSANIIDAKKGGAGLGLFKILYSSHALVCNVALKKETEIISVIDLEEQLRDFSLMTRSIHYFPGN